MTKKNNPKKNNNPVILDKKTNMQLLYEDDIPLITYLLKGTNGTELNDILEKLINETKIPEK